MKLVTDGQQPPTTHDDREVTYGCEICQDRGVTLEIRETKVGPCVFSRPCVVCEFGQHADVAFRAMLVNDVKQVKPDTNRKLRLVPALAPEETDGD